MLKHRLQEALRNSGWNFERIRDPFADQKMLLAGRDVRTIFDCGANEGGTAVTYRRLFSDARIYSFEPSQVYDHLALRRLPNVKPIKLALSDTHGDQTFYEYDISGYNSFSRCTEDFVHVIAETKVPTETIDRFCESENIATIDILKLDIQGAELKALRGAERMLSGKGVGLIYCEVLFRNTYSEQAFFHQIATWLEPFGYRLFRFYDLRYAPDRQFDYCDAIFCPADIYENGKLRQSA